jgi:hypothetical protein
MSIPQTRTLGLFATAVILGALGALAITGQAQTPQPGPRVPVPAADVMKVTGSVTVANTPTVSAQQSGTWIVGLAGNPVVTYGAPSFITRGRAYVFTLPSGKSESGTVADVHEDGWLTVDVTDGGKTIRKWINPAMLPAIEAKPQ